MFAESHPIVSQSVLRNLKKKCSYGGVESKADGSELRGEYLEEAKETKLVLTIVVYGK